MKKKIIPSTPFGPAAILWSLFGNSPKVIMVLLSTSEVSARDRACEFYPDSQASSCAEIDAIATAIESFLHGESVRFSFNVVPLSLCSPFKQSVLHAEHRIPRGRVSTYQWIAPYLNNRNGARADRALPSSHSFGPISRWFSKGLDMKRALLRSEGLKFDSVGRVLVDRLHYEKKGGH